MDGSLLGPPRFTAVPMTPTRETIAAWTQGQKKNVISSGSGSLRALEASGRRQRLSTTATPPKTPLLAGQPRRRRDAILEFGRGAGDAPGHGVRAGRDSAI